MRSLLLLSFTGVTRLSFLLNLWAKRCINTTLLISRRDTYGESRTVETSSLSGLFRMSNKNHEFRRTRLHSGLQIDAMTRTINRVHHNEDDEILTPVA
jgi:hypothetical protein